MDDSKRLLRRKDWKDIALIVLGGLVLITFTGLLFHVRNFNRRIARLEAFVVLVTGNVEWSASANQDE